MHISSFYQRLKQSDTRAMNRKLRRAFDMPELSSMSNSIIENIIIDIDGIRAQYIWVEEKCNSKEWGEDDATIADFFPILESFQDILKEIGNLRIALNDLQVEYVKKIEERGVRLEEEVKKKYKVTNTSSNSNNEKKAEQSTTKGPPLSSSTSQGPFTWLTNVFQRSSSSQLLQKSTQDQDQQKSIYPSQSQESLHHGFLISNDNNIYSSSSIHPLAIPPQKKTEEDYYIKNGRRRKKSDFERYGPPSSFPERPSISEKTRKHRQSIKTPMVRASQSAGTMRKSKSMQAPVLEYAVRKKRSALGTLGTQSASPDLGGAFATSWLGNK